MNVVKKILMYVFIDFGLYFVDNIIVDIDVGYGSFVCIYFEMVDFECFVYEGFFRRKKIERM